MWTENARERKFDGKEVRRTTTKLSLAELGSTFRSRTNFRVVCTRLSCNLRRVSTVKSLVFLPDFFFCFFFLDA